MSKKLTTAEMGRMNIDQYKESDKLPLVVVLDNVRSQHNVGAVFRTADAMRIERVILCGICCCPPNAEIHKTALGAEESVEWQYYKNTLDAVHALQAEGYTVFAVEQAHDSVTLEDVAEQIVNGTCPNGKWAVVLGHEDGTKHSMNVSVTAGIVMYRLASSLRRATKK